MKIVVAYSGGLDTSIILTWLKEKYDAEIIAFCRDRMAHYKAPKTVVFGPLPKTSTGKMQKFLMRAKMAEELD